MNGRLILAAVIGVACIVCIILCAIKLRHLRHDADAEIYGIKSDDKSKEEN